MCSTPQHRELGSDLDSMKVTSLPHRGQGWRAVDLELWTSMPSSITATSASPPATTASQCQSSVVLFKTLSSRSSQDLLMFLIQMCLDVSHPDVSHPDVLSKAQSTSLPFSSLPPIDQRWVVNRPP
ncbi:unnamed protein product [Arctogadus glacialis]